MKVNDVLQRKGDTVVTITSDASVADLVALLAQHRIGAVVVSDDASTVSGIVSERDVVRRLAEHGSRTLDLPVAEVMTKKVHTCGPDDEIAELAGRMTELRIRHLPVLEEDRLVAIVSIGDVVKTRIDQLKHERDQLEAYVHQ